MEKTEANNSKPTGEPFECAHFPERPTCDVYQMTKTRAQDAKATSEARRWDFTSNLTRRNDHRNALIVQDGYSCWMHRQHAKKKKNGRLSIGFAEIPAAIPKVWMSLHRRFKVFYRSVPGPTMDSRCEDPSLFRNKHGLQKELFDE